MIVLSAKNICKSYGTVDILKNVSIHINEGEKVGIVGSNGQGKTTLMNILSGQLDYDSGEISIPKDVSVGYLKQNEKFEEGVTLIEQVESLFSHMYELEEAMEKISLEISEKASKGLETKDLLDKYDGIFEDYRLKGGDSYKSEIKGVLNSMAFWEDTYSKRVSALSGGEKTRLSLACLLLRKPKLLFLDEPTNHLDIGTLKWLEQFLKAYKGTVVLISHDRYFLNQIVDKIYEIENKSIDSYSGNYTFYAEEKKKRIEVQLKHYNLQQEEIAKEQDLIRRFKERGTEKLAKRAKSREKKLDNIKVVEKPIVLDNRMKIKFKELFKSGNDVIKADNLSKSIGIGNEKKTLFENLNLDVKSGEKICIVGANGIGKTTLLKMIIGELTQTSGKLKIGYNVKFGYYDQEQKTLTESKTVMEEMKDAYSLYTDGEMRNMLARFLFRGEDVFLKVGDLSGGEKARLSLLKLMLSGANVLIMDEPTNHLDIWSKEIFEEALLDFEGTAIIVSHDRYLLSKIPDKIIELQQFGATEYLGKYDYYMDKKQGTFSKGNYLEKLGADNISDIEKRRNLSSERQELKLDKKIKSNEQRLKQKEEERERRRKTRQKEKLEEEIEKLEEEIETLDAQLCREDKLTDFEYLQECSSKREKKKNQLEELTENWIILCDELE